MRFMIALVTLVGCVDRPLGADPPSARVIAAWDPLACGAPHRVCVELDGDVAIEASAPCELGSVTLDVPSFGAFYVRAGPDVADLREVGELVVDQPVVAWEVPP